MVPAFVALSPGTSLPFKIAGRPATLKARTLKSPPVAIAETIDAKVAAETLKVRETILEELYEFLGFACSLHEK